MAILTCNSPLHLSLQLHNGYACCLCHYQNSFYSCRKVEDDVDLPRISVRSLISNSS